MSQESKQLELFGGKLLFETGATEMHNPGPAAYIMASQTEDKLKYSQSFHEGSGLARFYADKTLQVESGVRSQSNEKGFVLRVKNGDCCVNTENGNVALSGNQITIEAYDELVLQAPKIRIGYSDGSTDDVKIVSSKIFLQAGSLCKLRNKIMYSNVFGSFLGAYVSANKWYSSLPG